MADEQVIAMLDALDKQVARLADVAGDLENCVGPFTYGFATKSLMDNVKFYNLLIYLGKVAEELGKIANVAEPVVAERITKRMQQDELESIKYDGYSYTPSEKTFVSVTADNKPIVLAWLKTHPDGSSLVREDFNANAFKSFVDKELEAGKKVHPSVSVFTKPTLSRRKHKG